MPTAGKKQPVAPRPTVVKPKAPPLGLAKIHIDAGISRAHVKGSAMAVCHGAMGNYLGSSALVIMDITDVATLEAIACREGLSLAEDLMLQNFVIASDSKQVISDIDRASK